MNKIFRKIASMATIASIASAATAAVAPLARRKSSWLILGLILAGVLIPQTAFAETDSKSMEDILGEVMQLVNLVFSFIHALFWPLLLMIGSLMDNDLIFGPGIGERLREIWVIMRNIVNIVFVFLLLVIAFYNVSGLGGEGNLAIKTILPKFVMALIVVNFSFLGCKVILDAANVVSMAVYDIASTVEYDEKQIENEMRNEMEDKLCTNPQKDSCAKEEEGGGVVGEGAEAGATACKDVKEEWDYEKGSIVTKMFCCNNLSDDGACEEYFVSVQDETDEPTKIFPGLNDFGTNFFTKLDHNNIGVIMAVNLGNLNKLTAIAEKSGGEIGIKDLTINILYSIFMYLVFAFAYAALFIVLLARLVVLWLVIALSPVIVLTWVVPQINQYASELNLAERFIKHLLAPIIIGLAMSIGYLMVDRMSNVSAGGVESAFMEQNIGKELLESGSSGTFLAPNISDLQQLMIAVIAVAVVWLGVFGAADQTIASSVTNKIKDFGQNAAKFAATLPTYLPFVPMPVQEGVEDKPMSLAGSMQLMTKLLDLPKERAAKKVAERYAPFSPYKTSPGFESDLTKIKAGMEKDKGDRGAEFKMAMESALGTTLTGKDEYTKLREAIGGKVSMPGTLKEFRGEWEKESYRREFGAALGVKGALPTELAATPAESAEPPPPASVAAVENVINNVTTANIKQQLSGHVTDEGALDSSADNLKKPLEDLVSLGKQERVRDIMGEHTENGKINIANALPSLVEAAATELANRGNP